MKLPTSFARSAVHGCLPLSRRVFPGLFASLLLSSVVTRAQDASSAIEATNLQGPALPHYSAEQLVDETQRRAFQFFLEKSDPITGLSQDRAKLDGSGDFEIASVASTGFELSALPVAVERGWITWKQAAEQAQKTLKFALTMPENHGFLYHFVNKRTGAREEGSEVSSIDTGILICGALLCGQYFGGETWKLAHALYDRADWTWLLTNGGALPQKKRLSHGWRPETGFIPYDYGFSEAVLMYVLAIGSKTHPIPADAWEGLDHPVVSYQGLETLAGGPIFIQQMPQNFFPMKGMRDKLGFDYWNSARNSILINRQFCMDHAGEHKGYGPNFWGLNAGDSPDGYKAFGAPLGPEDGTISPTGVLSSLPFAPAVALSAVQAIYGAYGSQLWGRYGFGNTFNADRNWFGDWVIGIDLGMAILGIENYRTGLIWNLADRLECVAQAYRAIGFTPTQGQDPKALDALRWGSPAGAAGVAAR